MYLSKYLQPLVQESPNSAIDSTGALQNQAVVLISDQPLPALIDVDQKNITDCGGWLNVHQIWGHLPQVALQAIAQSFHDFAVEPQTLIYQEGQTPIGLYLLKSGQVEIFRKSLIGQSLIRYRHPGDLFGYTLIANGVEGTYQTSAIALTQSQVLFLPKAVFQELMVQYPSIRQVIYSQLSQDLDDYAQRIAWEQVRIQALQSYIPPLPGENSILGSSKAAQKLTQQIHQAAANLHPAVFQAQLGTGKTFLAGLIHIRSELASQPFAEMNCADLPRAEDGRLNTDALFGRVGQQPGILELLERGTLLLDNVQVLSEGDRSRLIHYLKTGLIRPNQGIVGKINHSTQPAPPIQSRVRLILASPEKLDLQDIQANIIKIFTLPQRKPDIPDFAQYFLNKFCQEQNRPLLKLDQSDLRRLLSYDYPANIAELAEILHRAVIMTPPGHSIIPEQALWSVQSTKNAFRLDLLTHVPWLRSLFLNRWYPESIWMIMMLIFIPAIALGFLGPQTRDSSFTLNLFWAWWWPGYLFLFTVIGRLWCAVCPFMITGEWIRRISLWLFPRQQLTWNHQWLNRWGGWLMFGGFVLIYLWEKLWDLPHHADLSAWLLLTITAGAVVFSLIYERRLWCRHLCPIGGMNGMFAKLSMIELRSVQQMCGSQCYTFGCYKGTGKTLITFAEALPNEGQATGGCPLYSHPAQLQDNRDCMLCMTCLKGCPNRSAQLNFRFPCADLMDNHKGFWAEIALLLLLLGGVFMHHAQKILGWLGWSNVPMDADHLLISLPIALIMLSIPAILTYLTHAIARQFDAKQPDYTTVIYAYLPLTLAANLTHYIPAAITEAGRILPVLAQTLGYKATGLPSLTWSLDVAQFLQGITLISAILSSIYPLLKITQRSLFHNLPHVLLIFGLTVFFFKLMI